MIVRVEQRIYVIFVLRERDHCRHVKKKRFYRENVHPNGTRKIALVDCMRREIITVMRVYNRLVRAFCAVKL